MLTRYLKHFCVEKLAKNSVSIRKNLLLLIAFGWHLTQSDNFRWLRVRK